MSESRPRTAPRLSTAARLLGRLAALNALDDEHLAQRLMVNRQTIERFRAGELAMPLDVQMSLANLLADSVPELARDGRRLRGQVEAAMAYESRITQTHPVDLRRTNFW